MWVEKCKLCALLYIKKNPMSFLKKIFGSNKSKTPEQQKRATIVRENHEGSHGDHWAALFGVNEWYRNIVPKGIQGRYGEILVAVRYVGVKTLDGQSKYTVTKHRENNIELKLVEKGKDVITFYPSIKTELIIESEIIEVVKWMHSEATEAQLLIRCKETFLLYVFATDYLENEKHYLNSGKLNMKISAMALTIQDPPVNSNLADDFIGYSINKELMKYSIFDYIGKIKSIEKVEYLGMVKGEIVELQLIEKNGSRDYFNINLYINKENMHINEYKIGDRIAGLMWVHAEIHN